jgi:uncharacterized phage-associated protein
MKDKKLQNNANSIVTANEIRTILNDFRIGKKPLAKLLGWGETTIIRYMEGDIPTAEYSNKLRAIAEEPAYYYELLLQNKDNLTNVAFRKSKEAVIEKLIEKKINLVAQYIIYILQGDVCPSYVQMMLYYSQAFTLALYDRELFEEDYNVNSNNLPYIKVYDSMKKNGITLVEIPEGKLQEEDKNIIDGVIDAYSWYGPKVLRSFCANERNNFRISRDKEGRRIIAKEIIKNYFKGILSQYDIHNATEINKYSDKRFFELKNTN